METNESKEKAERAEAIKKLNTFLRRKQIFLLIRHFGWYFLAGITILFVTLFLLYQIVSSGQSQKNDNTALTALAVLESPTGDKKEALKQMRSALKSSPELQTKYDAPLAQILMTTNFDASTYANRALNRVNSPEIALYIDFSKTTLLINDHQFEEALSDAQKLRTTILNTQATDNIPSYHVLFAYNDLRIAMLYQALENHELERKSWNSWLKNSQKDSSFSIPPESFQHVDAIYKIGDISLTDYIKHRLENI